MAGMEKKSENAQKQRGQKRNGQSEELEETSGPRGKLVVYTILECKVVNEKIT